MFRVRWLGRVAYADAHAAMTGLWRSGHDDHLLLLEHPSVYTLGVRADLRHVLVDPASVGADLVRTNRGGDVTWHGPGQLVGYPVVSVPMGPNANPCYVHGIEQLVIDTLADLGLPASRLAGYPGVWVGVGTDDPRKICAIGVRVSRGRSMHGFALNVSPDMTWFDHIVPCGIPDKRVTSMAVEGIDVPMRDVVDAVVRRAAERWAPDGVVDRQDVAWRDTPGDLSPFTRSGGRAARRLAQAGVDAETAVSIADRKPEWLRRPVVLGEDYRKVKRTMRSLDLVTVCEEAGCPNITECWADGTATFMLNGDRCTRACGFCLVDTRLPVPPDPDEPARVAEAVATMGLAHAVVTAVARDDLADGGAHGFAATVAAIRARCPGTRIEVLIPDCKGDAASLDSIFAARPDVVNHNLETVARLQRAVRPSAGYARSLAVLSRAAGAGLTTKSGIILGLGETADEVRGAMADLRGVGVELLTLGQYLRPTADHLPVDRWWTPAEFDELRLFGLSLGFGGVEAAPLARSSYHARALADGGDGVRRSERATPS